MLQLLRIQNIALIDQTEISFKSGLNILSGETGAGKSIVVESIALLLGNRANAELIRSGCDEAQVEGLFEITELAAIQGRLREYGLHSGDEPAHELIIRRIVQRSGRSRVYVNGALATLSTLQGLCEGLIDLCSQHEHQSLLHPNTQVELLDRYGSLSALMQEYREGYLELNRLQSEIQRLKSDETERLRKLDFTRFQENELREAQLRAGEDDELHAEKTLLQSAESRAQLANAVIQILDEEESGVLTQLRAVESRLKSLAQWDPASLSAHESLTRAISEAEDCSQWINRYGKNLELQPDRLQAISERLSLLATLKKKYGPSIEGLMGTLETLSRERASLEGHDERLAELEKDLQTKQASLFERASRISQKRKKIALLLSDSISHELQELQMAGARFKVDIESQDKPEALGPTGLDTIQFLIQTNAGEQFHPLGKIASGGELSRVMLSVRRTIGNRGGIGVYLFDEIDAGIGGKTAFQVGKKLRSVAEHNQVLCITHLPQVASFADHHWVVRKSTQKGRTLTQIRELTATERKEELARMLGGTEVTPASLKNAAELLKSAQA